MEQDWQKVDTSRLHSDLDWAVAEGEDQEEWECVACGKSFRSEAAWDSHERSKKHLKEVERLKREMELEDEDIDLGHSDNAEYPPSVPSDGEEVSETGANLLSTVPSDQEEDEIMLETRSRKKDRKKKKLTTPENNELAAPEIIQETGGSSRAETPVDTDVPAQPSKREKRRAREAKKAETQKDTSQQVCAQY